MLDKKNIQDIYTLSPMQEGMLFQSIYESDSIYFMQFTYQINDDLNLDYLKESFQQLIDRYDIFRTIFKYENLERPLQIVLKNRKHELFYEDISNIADLDSKTKYINAFKKQNKTNSFDLSKDLLTKMAIFKLDENEYKLIWSFHHILMDGWCMQLVFSEFMKIYNSKKEERKLNLPKAIQYSNFIKWLTKQDQKKSIEYWGNYLDSFNTQTGFLQKSWSGKASYKKHIQTISNINYQELINISKKYGITLNNLFTTIWGFMLSKYCGSSDVVFGAVVSGRSTELEDVDSIIGLFINTLPVRIKFNKDIKFLEQVKGVQANAVKSLNHQQCSLAEIQTGTSLKNNLFNHIIVFENHQILKTSKPTNQSDTITSDNSDLSNISRNSYDLEVLIVPSSELNIIYKFNSNVYDQRTVNHISKLLEEIIDSIIVKVESNVKDISFLSYNERDYLLNKLNDTKCEYNIDKSIIELFEDQVNCHPDKIAIVFNDKKLSYSNLNNLAIYCANELIRLGAKRNMIIGILLDQNIDIIISILGILKIGAAFLPCDKTFPKNRINYMLKDSYAEIIITRTNELKKVNYSYNAVNLDLLNYSHIHTDKQVRIDENEKGEFAYVIYTSGSTGLPKGVLVKERSLFNYISWVSSDFDIKFNDKALLTSSYAFDLGYTSIFSSITNGAELHVIESKIYLNSEDLINYIRLNEITYLKLTPSLFNPIITSPVFEYENIKTLRLIVFGGEKINVDDLEKLKGVYKDIKVINHFGPTECTIGVIAQDVDLNELESYKINTTIGKPINNNQVIICDEDANLQPFSAIGEICVAGENLAQGYLNNPELTMEKFIENSNFTGNLYRTGDIGRWLYNEKIEFLGRKDQEVKIRGYRIDLNEIKLCLLKFDHINEALVNIVEKNDNKFIVAYLVTSQKISIENLKLGLSEYLPEYMIPLYFIEIDKIPLTKNGKADIKQLPLVTFTKSDVFDVPKGMTEKKLHEIYIETLLIEKIGVNDSFFDMGGHSIRAMKLLSKINKELKVKLALTDVFENPTIRELAVLIEKGNEHDSESNVRLTEKKEYYPMSSAQKRMYIVQQADENSIAYNRLRKIDIKNDINKERITGIFNQLIKRHESFRTSFEIINDHFVQKIADSINLHIDEFIIDESQLNITIRDFVKPFKLDSKGLFRVAIIHINGKDNKVVLIDMHHIITDGRSNEILISDFDKLLNNSILKPQFVQYKDIATWRDTEEYRQQILKQKEYWLQEFNSDITMLELPYDYSRPLLESNDGGIIHVTLNESIMSSLSRISRENKVTNNMMMASIFSILLSRLSGQNEVSMGMSVDGRLQEEIENTVGMLVNTVVLKVQVNENESFVDFLKEVKSKYVGAIDNQEYQFDELVDELKINRVSGQNPLFNVMLNNLGSYSNNEIIEQQGENYIIDNDYMKRFDLTLNISEYKNGLYIGFQFYRKIFKSETILAYVKYFENILNEILDNPLRDLSEIDFLKSDEKEKLLYEFNNTGKDISDLKNVIDLFNDQVYVNPDHEAIEINGNTLNYHEFSIKIELLASILLTKGVKPNTVVPIMVNRSIEMLVGVFGILKAGGAYLPISPKDPEERIKYILQDSGADVLLTTKEDSNDFNSNIDLIYLENEIESKVIRNFKIDNNNTQNNRLEYIIYTSGTTGRPKGVMIDSRSLSNRLNWMKNYYNVSSEDIFIQKTPYTFDVSVWELYLWAICGAKLGILEPDAEKEPSKIIKAIANNRVSIIHFVPSMLKIFLNVIESDLEKNIDKLLTLKHVICSGEALKKEDVLKFNDLFKSNQQLNISNLYGPTEATIDVTYFNCNNVDKNRTVPIGKPIDNTEIYILSNNLKLCAVGVIGELYIGGIGLARGYMNKSELDNEKFILNPHKNEERIYRTGDLARWLPDGNIEYVGRVDDQVKIRGNRIELSEIESFIEKYVGVNESVVTVNEDQFGNKYLCAYYVRNKFDEIGISEFKLYLGTKLPNYMIPSKFIELEKLPLTSNGKIDKKALPYPLVNLDSDYKEPSTYIEKQLTSIWSEVLEISIEKIGTTDNFFDVGGNSLNATILISAIYKKLQVEISYKDVFNMQTIEKMSLFIVKQKRKIKSQYYFTEKKEYYSLSSAQKRLYVVQQFDKASLKYNIFDRIVIDSDIDLNILKGVFNKLILRHEILRTSFINLNGKIYQKISENIDINIEKYKKDKNNSLDEILVKFIRPFELDKAPLVRLGVLKDENNKMQLLIDIHHIITDAVSITILINDLYKLLQKEKLNLLKYQYKDYSEMQHSILFKNRILEQEKYWLSELKENSNVLNLKPDILDKKNHFLKNELVENFIDKDLTSKIRSFVRLRNISLSSFFLGVCKLMFHVLTQEEDIIIGSVVNGRRSVELLNIVGYFVNILPVRTNPKYDKKIINYLNEVNNKLVELYDNQEYPLDELIVKLRKQGKMYKDSLFGIVLEFNNISTKTRDLQFSSNNMDLRKEIKKADFSLLFRVQEFKDEILLNLLYFTSLYKIETAENLLKYFIEISRQIIEEKSDTIGDLKIGQHRKDIIVKNSTELFGEFQF
ncbi:MAG: amino acid adenylation domain-containing protein [Bacteroidales bacterium]|nr:amino acid adenylation domain-containing protein [Bacteroidales bacterium]